MKTVIALAIVIGFLGVSRGDERAVARAATKEGARLYDIGEFAQALAAFKKAYLASEDPKLLFDIAESQRQLGNSAEALRVYKSYLNKLPGAANAAEVRATIASLEAPPPPPPTPVAPVAKEPESAVINVVLDGPAANDEKRTRCYAAIRQAGIVLVADAEITAVLKLAKENLIQIVSRQSGVLREETRPRWGTEQLCVDAAHTAQAATGKPAPVVQAAPVVAGLWGDPKAMRLREHLRDARKARNRANAQLVFGSLFVIAGVGMFGTGLGIMASSKADSVSMGAGGGIFGGGLLGFGGVGAIMLGYGSINLKKARTRINETEAELDRISGVTR